MCGRYTLYIDTDHEDIVNIVSEVEKNLIGGAAGADKPIATGEIFPTNTAPVLLPSKHRAVPETAVWGFPNFHKKGVIINARAETVPEKPMFRQSFYLRRCVVPSTGFFEWDKEKTKYLFRLPDSDIVYMAGLYNEFDGEKRFLILTADANPSVAGVHSRMPVVLPKARIGDWLFDFQKAGSLLRETPPELIKQAV